jgi:hypothetical protein
MIAAWFHSKSEGDTTCICLRGHSRLREWTIGSWRTVKMNLPQEVYQQSTCKRICSSKCQLTNRINHPIMILRVGVMCSPTVEYPAFQSNITQADTHLSRYTVSWPRRSQYWQTFTASETTHTFASWPPCCWCPVTSRREVGPSIFNLHKTHSKAGVPAGPTCSSWLNSSSRTVILHCDAFKLSSTVSTNL